MGTSEYVVLFVAIVYFLGGYVLGRCHSRHPTWRTDVDPDPIREGIEGELAEVIPLRPLRAAEGRARAARADRLSALAWVSDPSRTTYRGLDRRRPAR
jgi:hypothetical protein